MLKHGLAVTIEAGKQRVLSSTLILATYFGNNPHLQIRCIFSIRDHHEALHHNHQIVTWMNPTSSNLRAYHVLSRGRHTGLPAAKFSNVLLFLYFLFYYFF